jgi:pyruvate dehydrogenase E2 component (dihydrolipoamide acetyltransferase)
MSKINLVVPDIGGAEGAEVVEVLVAVGDRIEKEQSLIVLESDKASLEIPATEAGVIAELRVAVGDALSEGDVILVVVASDEENVAAVETVSSADTASEASPEDDQDQTQQQNVSASRADGTRHTESTSMTIAIPDIGTDGAVELIEWCIEVGDAIDEGDSLVVLESDKASMEVPAPASGVLTEKLVTAGSEVSQGTPIAVMVVELGTATQQPGTDASAPSEAPIASAAEQPLEERALEAETIAASDASVAGSDGKNLVYAGPAVRKLAREFGVPLSKIAGTGPRGRIVKEDLHRFVSDALSKPVGAAHAGSAAIPEVPDIDFSKFGAVEIIERSRIDKVTATNMQRSWLHVPHVTQFDDADITELEAFRASLKSESQSRGIKLSPLAFILKASAVALNANPKLKSSLAQGGEVLVYKQYCHIGMAVDTPSGLVVPVIKDVDQKSIWQIAEEIGEMAAKARDRKLAPADMQGAVFTVSSLGGIGGTGFTPIVNTPEVAILGVSRADVRPVWDGDSFLPRTMLPLALSYDHRVVNGGDAGRFLTQLTSLLSDIRRQLLGP